MQCFLENPHLLPSYVCMDPQTFFYLAELQAYNCQGLEIYIYMY